jgi:hypothetical protein
MHFKDQPEVTAATAMGKSSDLSGQGPTIVQRGARISLEESIFSDFNC